ncbi:YqzE family protein [Oceanobacillus manasiensis]|uniref:YqzE family protein n=1 Tax=Oceanobacillus manasiensis TaxID=586413 RepID=UPI000A00895D|nr:YqzE family protein [Oceanobacillus manasiensis]
MSGNDYLKFVTEQVVAYIDLPPEERKKRKKQEKTPNQLYSSRWLGVLPFALKTFMRK